MHDKDLRHKMRQCKDFNPEDFEIDEEFTMTKHLKKRKSNIFDDEEESVLRTAEFSKGELVNTIN